MLKANAGILLRMDEDYRFIGLDHGYKKESIKLSNVVGYLKIWKFVFVLYK